MGEEWSDLYVEEVKQHGWELAYDEELKLSQEEREEMAEVCQLSMESESDSETSTTKMPSWWTRWLLQAVQDSGMTWPVLDEPILVASCCTGCSSESAVLKAMASVY